MLVLLASAGLPYRTLQASPKAEQATELAVAQVFRVDDFEGDTDLQKINQALATLAAIGGAKILEFSPREYRIRPEKLDTFEPVVGVAALSNLVLEGNRAVLIAQDALDSPKGYFFKISQFENLVVRNLTLTYHPAPFVQGVIVCADQPNNRTTIRLDPRFNHLDQLRQTPHSRLLCRVGIQGNPHRPKAHNPSWMDVGVDAENRLIFTPDENGLAIVDAGAINLELALQAEHNWKAGDPIVIWKRAAQDGFCFENGRQLRLENVHVESALHYAIKLRGIIGATIRDCHVEPTQGTMLSSSADGLDVQQSRNIAIEGCTLIATGDDAISFLNHGHGYNGENFEQKFAPPYPETNERVLLKDNQIEGGNRNGILLLASQAEVIGNTVRDIRQYGLKFTGDNTRIESNRFKSVGTFTAYQHIQDELDTGIICSDEWIQSNVSILNNTIEDWQHMPGILLKSVHQARVTGNTFILHDPAVIAQKPFTPYLNSMKAICVTLGTLGDQSLNSADLLIQGNTLQVCGGWTTAEEAIVLNGQHDRIVVKENALVPIE